MYVHAYQSYVWNAIVSERIRTYGSDAPVPGDLVYENDTDMAVDIPDVGIAAEEKGELGTLSYVSRIVPSFCFLQQRKIRMSELGRGPGSHGQLLASKY